jgi:type IV pilus assembly protein PilA
MPIMLRKFLFSFRKLWARGKQGFTLMEILLVVGIIGILAAAVIVALNPARQFAQARNAQRWSNINALLNAVYQYAVDNNGLIPAAITTTVREICNNQTDCIDDDSGGIPLIELQSMLVGTDQRYLTALPSDPRCPDPSVCATDGGPTIGSGYTIVRSANGRITVSAPAAELGVTIQVTR